LSNQAVEIISPNPSPPKSAPLSIEDRVALDIGPDNARLAIAICDELAVSSDTLKVICGRITGRTEDSDAEAARCQFSRWRIRSATLSTLYARARESRADVIADECIAIVDLEPDPQKARIKFDARRWYAGKCNRGMYGDEPQQVGVTNVNVHVDHSAATMAALSDRLAKRAKQLSANGGGMLGEDEKGVASDTPTLIPASRT